MDNTGHTPLRVPGFGIPLNHELPTDKTFAHGLAAWRPWISDEDHGFTGWRQVPTVTEHELAMVRAINMITDLPNWPLESTDNVETVQAWREYVRAECPQLTDRAWEWCVQELCDKRGDYAAKGFVAVLDTGSVVCKSDVLLQPHLVASLADSTQGLFKRAKDQSSPFNSAPYEVNAVDPHMYPLVYGRSCVLQNGGRTCLDDPFGTQHADPAPVHLTEEAKIERDVAMRLIQSGMTRYKSWSTHPDNSIKLFQGHYNDSRFLWSPHFQSLPCEVEVESSNGEVRITSYINNLHSVHNRKIYHDLEKLIALSIEPWNSCLIKGSAEHPNKSRFGRPQKGRIPARIPTMGRTWINDLPLMALAFRDSTRPTEPPDEKIYSRLHEVTEVPSTPTPEAWAWAEWYLSLRDKQVEDIPSMARIAAPDDRRCDVWQSIAEKATKRRDLLTRDADVMPEPAMTLSYAEWRAGRYKDPSRSTIFVQPRNRATIAYSPLRGRRLLRRTPVERLDCAYYQGPLLNIYDIRLQDYLRSSGLQVIVKVGSLALTPERPHYAAGFWNFPGHLNEHIVATSVAVLEVNNLSPCSLELRQPTAFPAGDYHPRDVHESYPLVFAPSMSPDGLAIQEIGKIDLRAGRLMTFPNVMESRLSACHLIDLKREGHIRFVKLYLVDPNYRICSTRNVPAQQYDWWAEVVHPILQQKGLPVELCELVTKHCDGSGMLSRQQEAELDRQHIRAELEALHCAQYQQLHH